EPPGSQSHAEVVVVGPVLLTGDHQVVDRRIHRGGSPRSGGRRTGGPQRSTQNRDSCSSRPPQECLAGNTALSHPGTPFATLLYDAPTLRRTELRVGDTVVTRLRRTGNSARVPLRRNTSAPAGAEVLRGRGGQAAFSRAGVSSTPPSSAPVAAAPGSIMIALMTAASAASAART